MITWLIDTAIALTLLMVVVLMLRRPVAHLFGAGWAYALWLLPLLRIVMPPFDLFGSEAVPLLPPLIVLVPETATAAAPVPVDSWLAIGLPSIIALWLGGAAVFAMWQQSSYSAFLLSLGNSPKPAEPSAHGGIPVVASGAVDGPLAVGLLTRRIVVPLDFAERYSPAERRFALDHELIHHRRGDLWWNMAALVVLGLTWFNPVSWIAFRAFRIDQELACDAAVAARVTAHARHDYASALVKSASRPGQVAACPLNSADQLKQRLRMMKQHRISRARSIGGGVALSGLLLSGLAVSSAGFARDADQPAPQFIVQRPGMPAPLIDEKDLATLASRCGAAAWEDLPRVRTGGYHGARMIVCEGESAAADPEVRAIVGKAMARLNPEAAPPAPPPPPAPAPPAPPVPAAPAGDPAPASPPKMVKLAAPDVDSIVAMAMATAPQALTEARVKLAGMPIGRAVAHPGPTLRALPMASPMTAEQREDFEGAMADARREAEEHRREQAELQRELAAAERETQREVAREMREAEAEIRREMRRVRIEMRDLETQLRDLHKRHPASSH